ncbi:MAG: hypothetical protein KIT84_19360 [Labilithrix sp.]|nr:hypothetical protein [Labilithrix sp.]MCW5813194.1 hypothetical protein [Labilithrix sp.]
MSQRDAMNQDEKKGCCDVADCGCGEACRCGETCECDPCTCADCGCATEG